MATLVRGPIPSLPPAKLYSGVKTSPCKLGKVTKMSCVTCKCHAIEHLYIINVPRHRNSKDAFDLSPDTLFIEVDRG